MVRDLSRSLFLFVAFSTIINCFTAVWSPAFCLPAGLSRPEGISWEPGAYCACGVAVWNYPFIFSELVVEAQSSAYLKSQWTQLHVVFQLPKKPAVRGMQLYIGIHAGLHDFSTVYARLVTVAVFLTETPVFLAKTFFRAATPTFSSLRAPAWPWALLHWLSSQRL